jgi:hypothetical protein
MIYFSIGSNTALIFTSEFSRWLSNPFDCGPRRYFCRPGDAAYRFGENILISLVVLHRMRRR